MALRRSLILLFLCSSPLSLILACGNEYYLSWHSVPYHKNRLDLSKLLDAKDGYMPYWAHGFTWGESDNGRWDYVEKMEKLGIRFADKWQPRWDELRVALEKKIDFKLLSDYAWNEVKVGNRENAVKLLEALYKEHPGEYNIVANLGTAYEVTGKDTEALALLRKAVALNPASHAGSEWIHIRILEEKIKKEPDYRHVLALNGNKSYDLSIPADSLMVQLAYQLHERVGFVKSPDPVVGQLVKDFADLVVLNRSEKDAVRFYEFAHMYDSLVLTKKALPASAPSKPTASHATTDQPKEMSRTDYYLIAGGALAILLVYAGLRRNRKKTV